MLGRGGRYEQEIVISSPASMVRYALIPILTPSLENMTNEFGSHAWLIL
jgi:hypothetical protein